MTALTREALYDRVWTDPVRTVAAALGVSDVWLRKCCVQADIPIPERGYWTKLRAGKPAVRRKLPVRAPGQPDTVHVGQGPHRYGWSLDIEAELAKSPPTPPAFDEPIDDVRARVVKMVCNVAWRRDLSKPHSLIAKLLADDAVRKQRQYGTSYRLRSDDTLFSSPFERRRLKVLSSLFLGLAKTGARPWIEDDEARKIGFVVGAQRVAVSLDHPDAKPDRQGRFQTREGFADVLRLAIGGTDRAWSDTVDEALEAHLTEIAVEIVVAGEVQFRAGAQASYEWSCQRLVDMRRQLDEQRAEAVREARERAVQAERERQRSLIEMAIDHGKAQQIRALVDDVVRARGADAAEVDRVAQWAAWANAIADRADPVLRLSFDADGRASLAQAAAPQHDE